MVMQVLTVKQNFNGFGLFSQDKFGSKNIVLQWDDVIKFKNIESLVERSAESRGPLKLIILKALFCSMDSLFTEAVGVCPQIKEA